MGRGEEKHCLKKFYDFLIPSVWIIRLRLSNVNFEPTFNEKEDKFQEEKKAITRKALEFIEEGDTILLDAGTTTFQLVKELRAFSKLTVVTNSLVFSQELQDVQGIDVVMVGGIYEKRCVP